MPTVLTPAAEALAGVGMAARGARAWARAPRLMALGMVPGLITAVLLGGGMVALLLHVDDLGRALAGWAGLDQGWLGSLAAVTASLALLAGAAVVAVPLFTALTLTIGGPFFEAISRRVDDALGDPLPQAPEERWTQALRRSVREGLVTVAISVALSLAVFGLGLVPVVGAALAFGTGAVVGGRLLTLELTAFPMARRGVLARRDRIAMLRPYRWRALGFGMVIYLVFLVPFGALLTMPIAVVGATLLTRHAWRQP